MVMAMAMVMAMGMVMAIMYKRRKKVFLKECLANQKIKYLVTTKYLI
jgi:hypothetical protein